MKLLQPVRNHLFAMWIAEQIKLKPESTDHGSYISAFLPHENMEQYPLLFTEEDGPLSKGLF